MLVSGISGNFYKSTPPITNTTDQQSAITHSPTSGQDETPQTTSSPVGATSYDFTNMSRREFDALWKAGEIDMDLPPLILPSEGIDLTKNTKLQMDAVYDRKINYIEYFEGRIKYQQSLPKTQEHQKALDHYTKSLNVLLSLQGNSRNSHVDVTT